MSNNLYHDVGWDDSWYNPGLWAAWGSAAISGSLYPTLPDIQNADGWFSGFEKNSIVTDTPLYANYPPHYNGGAGDNDNKSFVQLHEVLPFNGLFDTVPSAAVDKGTSSYPPHLIRLLQMFGVCLVMCDVISSTVLTRLSMI